MTKKFEALLESISAIEHRLVAQRRGLVLSRLLETLDRQVEGMPRMVAKLLDGVMDFTISALHREEVDNEVQVVVKKVLQQAKDSFVEEFRGCDYAEKVQAILKELRGTESEIRLVLSQVQEHLEDEWQYQKRQERVSHYDLRVAVCERGFLFLFLVFMFCNWFY